ncbi:hypothetical protein [Sinorhizobium fredii]|uniref:hypothetical protein n=1 Tax=Rhizobium fredii TaxID=380 RepID=UPI0035139A14
MKGKLISSKADFPDLQVYWDDRANVARIAFKNPEMPTRLEGFTAGTVIIAAIGGAITGFDVPGAGPTILFICLLAAVWAFRLGMHGRKMRRVIEIDFGKDEFRVIRNGSITVKRQLQRLTNLTIERHPEAELEYRKLNGRLGPKQKQHCLFGFFGTMGAEKVLLVSRYEYPSQESLYQVSQAILWAVKETASRPASVPAKAPERPEPQAVPQPVGIKPPLD